MIYISDLVREALNSGASPHSDPRVGGATLAAKTWPDKIDDMSELINIGTLAYGMRDRVIVHELRPGVCNLIADTDLHSLPSEPPRLLHNAWIFEARKGALFGETFALGGYAIDGKIFFVGLEGDGARISSWDPDWIGGDLPEHARVDQIARIDARNQGAHVDWTRQAARFALVAALALEAEATPIKQSDDVIKRGGRKGVSSAEWVTRHVVLGASNVVYPKNASDGSRSDDADLLSVNVRGHLKRQRHGPENALTKWIYVAEYSARRWVSPKPLKIVVRS